MHNHKFIKVGGGCSREQCDNEYKCNCGAEFTVFTNIFGHWQLPYEINEIKLTDTDKKLRETMIEKLILDNDSLAV